MPDGDWQVETGLIDWSRDDSGGLTTDTTMWGSSAIKYGVSSNFDVELWVTPLEAVSMHGGSLHEHASSVGDTVLRIKYEITKSDAPVQVALDPFVKIPTASRIIGNGKAEAGLMVPIEIALGKSPFTVTLDPEVDWLADENGAGHHASMIQLVNLGWQANKKLIFTTELWRQWDWDPSRTGKQASWDGSVAYLVSKDLQLDAGANVGLNRETPDVELYPGVSMRF